MGEIRGVFDRKSELYAEFHGNSEKNAGKIFLKDSNFNFLAAQIYIR